MILCFSGAGLGVKPKGQPKESLCDLASASLIIFLINIKWLSVQYGNHV